MTNYTFTPQTPSLDVDWDDPTIWSGGVVPEAPDADVVIPETDVPGQTYAGDFEISINTGESYAVNSVSVAPDNAVAITGALSVAGTLSLSLPSDSTGILMQGGSLSVGVLDETGGVISGTGTISSSAIFDNTGEIDGSGLTITAPGFINDGLLLADGGTLAIDDTGAAVGDGGASIGLGGGAYESFGGTLAFEESGALSTIYAPVAIGQGGVIETVDPATGNVQVLQDTLQNIASSGTLDVYDTSYASAVDLRVDGILALDDGQFSAPELVINDDGIAGGYGTIAASVVDYGAIVAVAGAMPLIIDGAVTGGGPLYVGAANPPSDGQPLQLATLQLDAADQSPVLFESGGGVLIIADPQDFTGAIQTAAPQIISDGAGGTQTLVDDVVLAGIAADSVTGEVFSGNGTGVGGTLTITEGGVSQNLTFDGDFDTASFALSAGPTVDGSSSLQIAITPLPLPPSLALAANPDYQGIITDDVAPSVIGTTSAGTTVQVQSDGAAAGSDTPQAAGDFGSQSADYQITLSPSLAPGAHTITATATNSAGSTAAYDPLYLFVLPSPVGGIVEADVSSAQIGALLDDNYTMQFVSGTEAIQLTDGTLSVGTNTGAAYMQRLYEGLLGRAADTGGLVGYNDVLNQQGPAAVASDILASAEFTQLHGQIASLSDAQYVTLLYGGLLGRAPEASSLASDTAALAAGVSRGALAANIATSSESANHLAAATANVWVPNPTDALITELYQTALNRAPDLPGLAGSVQALVEGATPLQLANALAASPEFLADHAGQGAAQLVTSFYQDGLGRAPDPGGLQTYTNAIQSGAGTGTVLLAIASSPEAAGHLIRTV